MNKIWLSVQESCWPFANNLIRHRNQCKLSSVCFCRFCFRSFVLILYNCGSHKWRHIASQPRDARSGIHIGSSSWDVEVPLVYTLFHCLFSYRTRRCFIGLCSKDLFCLDLKWSYPLLATADSVIWNGKPYIFPIDITPGGQQKLFLRTTFNQYLMYPVLAITQCKFYCKIGSPPSDKFATWRQADYINRLLWYTLHNKNAETALRTHETPS